MKNHNRLLALHTDLMRNLDEAVNVFLRDRPFLEDPSLEPKIKDEHTDDEIVGKIENEYERREIVEAIQKALKP